jgi:hypothetical protein
MTWAGFHADAVDHAVRAFAFTDLLDPPEDVPSREIDDVGGAVPAERLHGIALGDFDEVEMGAQGEKVSPRRFEQSLGGMSRG